MYIYTSLNTRTRPVQISCNTFLWTVGWEAMYNMYVVMNMDEKALCVFFIPFFITLKEKNRN